MNNKISLFLAILVAWNTLGALLYEDRCCQAKISPKVIKTPGRLYFHGIILKDEDKLNIKLLDNFIFYKSTSGYLLPLSDSLKQFIDLTAEHLKKYPTKKINLICRYNPIESLKNTKMDWGKLRAQEIEKMFLTRGVPENQIITTSLRDSLLPMKNNRIFGGFIPIITNK